MAHTTGASPTPQCAPEDVGTTLEHATDSVESRSAAIVSAISSLAQQTIRTSNELSQHCADVFDAAPFIAQRDAVIKSFDEAIKAIRAETYRASSQVSEAMRMSQALHSKGPVTGSVGLPGVDPNHQINSLLSLVDIEGKSFYQLAKTTGLRMPHIIISPVDGGGLSAIPPIASNPAFVILPTTKNVKILQHAYGRALRHKIDRINDYIAASGIENTTSAPKRNKPAHENDALLTLPQKHRLGTFLDMNMVQPGRVGQTKVDDSELVLAFLLPTGDHQYVEAISGNGKDEGGIGETDLVIPVSDDAIKLLYELYCGVKDCIARRKAAAGAQGLAQTQPAHDPTDVALFRRMRRSGLDDEDNNSDPGSKRMRTSD